MEPDKGMTTRLPADKSQITTEEQNKIGSVIPGTLC